MIANLPASKRIESIDMLRGVVMVIMALDHIRDYFDADAWLFSPTDLSQTSAPLFLTRWITHFCAPVFVFLAGTSAYLICLRKGVAETSSFLLKRGLWLIALEFTIINFAWFFNIKFNFIAFTVIWALGVCMVILAGVIRLPFRIILWTSVAIILGHNAFDNVHFPEPGFMHLFWGFLHDPTFVSLGGLRNIFMAYGIVPWAAVMSLGYCFGKLYAPGFDPATRKKFLFRAGIAVSAGFFILRWTNLYGDPHQWVPQPTAGFTFLSLLNCNKYPPSLLYLMMTLGPACVFLSVTESARSVIAQAFTTIGRVPLFFYVVHIYVVHLIGLMAAIATGFPASAMVFNQWVTDSPELRGYGFGLPVVYLVWAVVIAALYPLCKWFDNYKRNHRDWVWLSYC